MTKSFLVLALFLPCATALANPPAPGCAPGWKGEVILESPNILSPSVVCCAPDGRVFVGEDFVDMNEPSSSAGDKIVTIYPDGQVLTFATNLHAVFGLKYIDGKLYVHHTPIFSVFDDFHSEGVHRVDLITNDNPHPWLPSFNDHIPSNFRLAMDGYLYFSTGDKGVFGAVGTDGRKIEMRGGVYRMRPDGTGLEVYCTGTRNHLDVAINSEDEIFTFDNTDDGGGWWRRLTHMVDGGFYGYPHDFKPQRPYTLWMMSDYGGGAPTGACCYNEDALPDEYKGNLFLCDWSGSQVFRVIVRRDGSTYKVVDEHVRDKGLDFITKGTLDDFRPVGICLSPDGKSFYVTDWGHSYWKRNEKMGRLLKITYVGKTQETPKPPWFVAAASGEKFDASIQDLVNALKHPSQDVRLVSQRRLAERGRAALRDVEALLKNHSAPAFARWSAIWTLDAIDGGKKGRRAIIAALKDKDVTVAMQAARELGTRSMRQATSALIAMLRATNNAILFRANTALGRIGDREAVPALMQQLAHKDLFARYAAFTALRRIGLADPKAWPRILDGFASTNAAIREGVGFAVRETYDPALVKALADFSRNQHIQHDTRTNIFGLLSSLSMKPPPWNGDWWNTQPVNSPPPANTVSWEGTPIVASALRNAIHDTDPGIRQIAINWVHNSHDTNAAAALAEMFRGETNSAVRLSILREMADIPSRESRAIIVSILRDPRPAPDLLLAAIEAAGKAKDNDLNSDLLRLAEKTSDERRLLALLDAFAAKKMAEAVPSISGRLAAPAGAVRQRAISTLKQIGGPQATDALLACLEKPDADLRRQAISALGDIKNKAALKPLITCAADPGMREEATTALTKMPDTSALEVYLDGLASKNVALRNQCETAVRAIQQPALPIIEKELGTTNLPSQSVAILKKIYDNVPAAKKSPIFRHKILEIPIEQFQDFALAHSGDSRRGRALFQDLKGLACARCHRIDGSGGDIGPDLTGIRAKYPRSFIIESVLYPSKQILDGYQQVLFVTKNDDDVSGLVRGETADEVTVIDSGGVKHVLKKSDIIKRKTSQISLMPDGLQTGLSLVEFSDLISYVENPKIPEVAKPVAHAAPPQPRPPVTRPRPPEPPTPSGAEFTSFFDTGGSMAPAPAPALAPPMPHAVPARGSSPSVPIPLPPRAAPPPPPVLTNAIGDISSLPSDHRLPPAPPGWETRGFPTNQSK